MGGFVVGVEGVEELCSIRISALFVVFIAASYFVSFLIPGQLYQKTVMISVSVFMTTIGIPVVIISRNENMKQFSKQIIIAERILNSSIHTYTLNYSISPFLFRRSLF